MKHLICMILSTPCFTLCAHAAKISTVEALVAAAAEAKSGAVIELAAGTFHLTNSLDLNAGVSLKGAGIGRTIITNAASWSANPATLPDTETVFQILDDTGYLLRCARDKGGMEVSAMTLTGPGA